MTDKWKNRLKGEIDMYTDIKNINIDRCRNEWIDKLTHRDTEINKNRHKHK